MPEAENAYRTAIQIAPDWEAPHFNLAVALEAMGQRPQAVIAFRQLLEAHPAHVDALFNLGHVYFQLRLYRQAQRHWKSASKLAPEAGDIRANLRFLRALRKGATPRLQRA